MKTVILKKGTIMYDMLKGAGITETDGGPLRFEIGGDPKGPFQTECGVKFVLEGIKSNERR